VRIGSLCSGYGGLDLAVGSVFNGHTSWVADSAAGPARILAERWPGVPNHGDITRIDWSTVEPIDIATAGYPCQPFSQAGRKQGAADERHLWPYVATAIRALRPRFVILENVSNHRRIGFGAVLGDLAALGYDACWTSNRAADVGAPHGRERVFVLAYPAESVSDTTRQRRDEGPRLRGEGSTEDGRLFASNGARNPGFQWLSYAAAVDIWEGVTGRPAPAPVVTGPGGGTLPSPRFVEWLMGLVDGWVTDVQGLTAEQQLEALGNGVCPQQARAAIRSLLSVCEATA
jgi:DNA (cytosine-5)-methyltransferase 1